MHLGAGRQEMTVIKFGYKHSSASIHLHSAIMSRVWCYVSPQNTGLSYSSSAEMRAQTPLSFFFFFILSFQSDCFLTDTASRQGWMILHIDEDNCNTRKLLKCSSIWRSICGDWVNFHCCTWVDNIYCKGRQERRSVDNSVLNDDMTDSNRQQSTENLGC